jgi:phosphoglycolate phosphatase
MRLIVYDLDGTLVDTLEDITASANHMLERLGLPPIPASDVRGYVGRGVRELVTRCLGTEDGEHLERGLRLYREHYGRHLLDRSRLYPGARETLEHFKRLGRAQAVITNKPDPYSTQILAGLGVEGYFTAIIAGDTQYPKKPDPASLRALMERSGAAPGETVFIGDSPVDVETGRRAGVLTVAVTHGLADVRELAEAAPEVTVAGFAELVALAAARRW